MGYPDSAWERAMRVHEVLLKALGGEIHWFRAADILGMSPRALRRWRERYEADGYAGLVDQRLYQPSPRRAPPGEVERVLRLYRERYAGFNVRHFHETVSWEHGVTLSYSFVKRALQGAGLVKTRRARGRCRACGRPPPAAHEPLGAAGPTAPRPTAPTGTHGDTLTKAVRSRVKRKRSFHLSATTKAAAVKAAAVARAFLS